LLIVNSNEQLSILGGKRTREGKKKKKVKKKKEKKKEDNGLLSLPSL
jgi:hypothetical protein